MGLIIGHRGARGLYPENTLEGFIRTIKSGIRSIELDLVVSKDKKLVVSHEPFMAAHLCLFPDGNPVNIDTAEEQNIFQMDYDTISGFDCGSIAQKEFPNQENFEQRKPLFKEVVRETLNLVDEDFLYLIEIKSDAKWYGRFQPLVADFAALLNKELEDLKKSNFIIQSFDPKFLNAMTVHVATEKLGLLVESKDPVVELERLDFSPGYLNPEHVLLDEKLVHQIRDLEIKIFSWTVNDAKISEQLMGWGVNGIISDYPFRHY